MTGAAEEERSMEPWEQHHSVINMPRYAYNAASILQKGNVGFLITCTFRREKSATKEALALLREFIKVTEASSNITTITATTSAEEDHQSNVEHAPEKRVKFSTAGSSTTREKVGENLLDGDCKSSSGVTEISGEIGADANEVKPDVTDTYVMRKKNENGGEAKHESRHKVAEEDKTSLECQEFMLVKLDTMGVIYISATKESPTSALSTVSKIIKDVQARARPPPQWCHRILPVQGTCSTKREEVQAVVSKLVKQYLDDSSSVGEEPINYAVAFNRRGADGSTEEKVFDRGECIRIVTAAVNHVTPNVKVDLTSPKVPTVRIKFHPNEDSSLTKSCKRQMIEEMVVVVELIPVAGARSSLICAVSVLPGDLIISKPKLTVKPLAPQAKKRKHH